MTCCLGHQLISTIDGAAIEKDKGGQDLLGGVVHVGDPMPEVLLPHMKRLAPLGVDSHDPTFAAWKPAPLQPRNHLFGEVEKITSNFLLRLGRVIHKNKRIVLVGPERLLSPAFTSEGQPGIRD